MIAKPEAQSLTLQAKILHAQIPLGSPAPVTIRLHNTGSQPATINPRMAVGYRSHLAREIFVDLHSESGGPVQVDEMDYNRDFLPPNQYTSLDPGESISMTFDLFEWYLPPQPGVYVLIFHYQADEALADPPEGVVRGVVSSAPSRLTVLPPVQTSPV